MSWEKWYEINKEFKQQRDKQITKEHMDKRAKYVAKVEKKMSLAENKARSMARSKALNRFKK